MIQTDYNLVPKSFYNTDTQALTTSKDLADKVQAGVQAKLDTLPPAAKSAFLAQIANLAPGDIDTPKELKDMLDKLENKVKTLVEQQSSTVSAFIGDVAKFLGRAMIEFATQQRQSALDDRMAARDEAKSKLLSQADQMDKAASKMLTGAIVNAVVAGVGAAISITSAVGSLKGQISAVKDMSSATAATKLHTSSIDSVEGSNVHLDIQFKASSERALGVAGRDFAMAEKAATIAGTKAQIGEAIGNLAKTTGASTDSAQQAMAKKDEAQGSRDAAEAQNLQQISDQKKEIQQAMDEMVKQIINFLKELQDSQVDAMRALTRV